MRNIRILVTLLTLVVMGRLAHAQDPSLVMFLKFDEGKGNKATDSSGKGNHAILKGKAKFGEGKYKTGLALGLNDHAEVPHNDSLNLQSMTLMTWVKITQLTGDNQSAIEKGPAWAPGEYNLLPVYGGSILLQIFDLPDECDDDFASEVVTDGNWHHIAGTFDGKKIVIYKDGEKVGGGPCEGKLETNKDPLYIGSRGGSSRWTVGFYDDMKIYNRALTAAEIRAAMEEDAGLPVEPKDRATVKWGELKRQALR